MCFTGMRAVGVCAVSELLEKRLMLDAWVSQNGSLTIWNVVGEQDAANRIIVRPHPNKAGALQALINGTSHTLVPPNALRIEVKGGARNDRISVKLPEELAAFQALVYGGDGNDTLINWSGGNNLYGGKGNDTIQGTAWREFLLGEEGNDLILGGGGNESLRGGAGNDTIKGGVGEESIYGEQGNDHLSGGANADTLEGGDGDDQLRGDDGNDLLMANAGADLLFGGNGADNLRGGDGNDQMFGQSGSDTVWGGSGKDKMVGGAGEDVLRTEFQKDWTPRNEQGEVFDSRSGGYLSKQGSDAALKQRLIDEAVARWSGRLGSASTPNSQFRFYKRNSAGKLELIDGDAYWGGTCGDFILGEWVPTGFCAPMGGPDYSGTNTQEADVDEADLVKTDGKHLYILDGSDLVVIEAGAAGQAKLISRQAIGGEPTGLYLEKGRLTVLWQADPVEPNACIEDGWFTEEELAHGMTCELSLWSRHRAMASVYDVSKPSALKLVEETELEGAWQTTRMVNGKLVGVIGNPVDLPGPRRTWHRVAAVGPDWKLPANFEPPKSKDGTPITMTVPEVQWDGQIAQVRGYYLYESEAEYRARLERMTLADLAPRWSGRTVSAKGIVTRARGGLLSGQRNYLATGSPDMAWYGWQPMTSVVMLDPHDSAAGPTSFTNLTGISGSVYVSAGNLYISQSEWRTDEFGDQENYDYGTNLYKLRLNTKQGMAELAATGRVPGLMGGDSFLMDEEDGYLRLATTSFIWDGTMTQRSSNVFVVGETRGAGAQTSSVLDIVGSIRGIAPEEAIFSSRFEGDRGYLVTFRQIDPLFTLNMSDPKNPRLVGEFKVPGFSTYLHEIGDGLVLGVGRNVDENTNFSDGVQVSLFDVAKPARPTRLAARVFEGGVWTNWGQPHADHHAFAYFPERGIAALPMSGNPDGNGNFREHWTQILKVGRGGIEALGVVRFNSPVSRNVRIGNYLYAIAAGEMKVVELKAGLPVVKVVAL